jgi:hypothetical protein
MWSIPTTTVAICALSLLAGVYIAVVVRRRWVRFGRQRQWARARRAESTAERLLTSLGYAVVGAQVQRSYRLWVDGRPRAVAVRADYVVTRGNQTYVAEVKSGNRAPLLETAATRRQLLEYLVAFGAHGVLLVDGESQRVHEVVFPRAVEAERGAWSRAGSMVWRTLGWLAVSFAALLAVALACGVRFQWRW